MKRSIFVLFLLIVHGELLAIDFSRVNVAWQYDPNAPVKVAHRVISLDGEITTFIQVKLDSSVRWELKFLLQNDYESEKHETITPTKIDTLNSKSGEYLLKVHLGSVDYDLLVLKIFKYEAFYYYDIGLKIGSLPFPSIYPATKDGYPILTNYINRSGTQWSNSTTYFAMKYEESFSFADPPMAKMKPLAPNILSDSTFHFSNPLELDEDNFYTIRKDSAALSGVTILRVPPYFPEYRQLPELVECMFYITSEPEQKSLMNAKDLKKNFDSFWINNFNTKPRARNAIRKYYNTIEQANLLFTDFKPGWKTDRGMMFIVFGKPDEVYRTTSNEEWYYDSGEAFEYSVISTFFAPRTYTLRRSIELEELWFDAIEAIRRGINE